MNICSKNSRDKTTIKTLFSEQEIAARVDQLATEIKTLGYADLMMISVLRGSFIFAADLARALARQGVALQFDFISISSYGASTTSGEVKLVRDVESDVTGKNILLVDDILETGKTLKYTEGLFLERGAASVDVAVLLKKTTQNPAVFDADYVGFQCPDLFVVGYGMDKGHCFRELPFIGYIIQ